MTCDLDPEQTFKVPSASCAAAEPARYGAAHQGRFRTGRAMSATRRILAGLHQEFSMQAALTRMAKPLPRPDTVC